MRRMLLRLMPVAVMVAACGGTPGAPSLPPSNFSVQPDISDPSCNGGQGVRLPSLLHSDPVVAFSTMPDESTLVALSELYPGSRFVILRSITRSCEPNPAFGNDGVSRVAVPSDLHPRHTSRAAIPTAGVWIDAIIPRQGGGAIVSGNGGGEWLVGEVTSTGTMDPTFGTRGWALFPFPVT